MIVAKNIKKSFNFGKTEVLNDVSIEINDGEFVAILGASGSGKSTLMNILSGLERADCGSVVVDETNLTELNDKKLTEFRKDNVGFIFQQYYLLPHLSVLGNIKLGANIAKNSDFQEIVQALGLSEKLKSKPFELSGGE